LLISSHSIFPGYSKAKGNPLAQDPREAILAYTRTQPMPLLADTTIEQEEQEREQEARKLFKAA
jgi:hypothetical protein